MSWHEIFETIKDFWSEFRKFKYGLVGVGLFFFFILLIIFEPFLTAFPEAGARWRDITYWEENPANAAPVWTNWFNPNSQAPQQVLKNAGIKVKKGNGVKFFDLTFNYNNRFDIPPTDMVFNAKGKGIFNLTITLTRPDGLDVNLANKVITLNSKSPIRITIGKEAKDQAMEFAETYESQENLWSTTVGIVEPLDLLLSEAKPGILKDPVPLKGNYKIKVSAIAVGTGVLLEETSLTVCGRIFGLLGTDSAKRDIWSGIVAGTKWALLIGLLTAAVSVLIGVLVGVVSAYCGGFVDAAIMRIYEVFSSIPLLPVLIVVSAIYKPSIWTLIFMMCAFFWVGSVRTVRSIGLQLKEETYIEAAHALGASGRRIIFKHLIPQLVPYAFASMALQVPSAIVSEASISLIGLGDATTVTWGQILHDAMQSGAVLQGIWWWIVPPGLFIAVMGMTFAFVGFAMDTILNPKLRTR